MVVAVLAVGLFINLSLGLFVLLRDYRSSRNRAFFALSLCSIFWVLANFQADITSEFTLFWNRASFLGPLLTVVAANIFLGRILKRRNSMTSVWVAGLIAILGCLIFSPYVVTQVSPRLNDMGVIVGYNVTRGWAYYVVISAIIGFIAYFVFRLLAYRRKAKGILRIQLGTLLFGLSAAIAVGMTTNILLPLLTNSSNFARFAPLTTVVLMGTFGYAIIKNRLFDIRPVLARSFGYVLSLVGLATIYGFVVFGTARLMFGVHFSFLAQLAFSASTIIAVVSFNRLKKIFDKLTYRLFFQDVYDISDFFDEINKALVSSLTLDSLLKRSGSVIKRNLNAEYCNFALEDGAGHYHDGNDDINGFSQETLHAIRQAIASHHSIAIFTDLLDENDRLKALLSQNHVGVVVRLSTHVSRANQDLGFILLGNKQNGHSYSKRDQSVLATLSRELVIAIQNALHFEEIQNFNLTLQEKVTDATKQLRNTNQRLKSLDETKDDFISMASHQLRTPLTSIKGYLSMVLEGDAGKITPLQRQMLNQAFISSQRMVFLIADLLNVSRLRTGKFVVMPTQVDLVAMIKEEIDQLKETADAREISINYDGPAEMPAVWLDDTKTRQVIMNFMDNAVYYSRSGGHVSISLKDTKSSVEIRITDDGIGVPKAEQHHLFTKFYRANNARQVRPDGTGLGLFMAKKVIVAQGGVILFSSKENVGSMFGMSFSKAAISKQPANTGKTIS